MLFSPFLITSAILALLAGRSSSCPENEIESECVNPCNTCELRHRCDPPQNCQPGCDCKPGFSRDENGYCVPEQRCPAKSESPKCPPNALYVPCAPSQLPTCENPHAEPDEDDECVPGCVCRTGLLVRKDERCVTPDQCHSKEVGGKETCQEDEEYYECTPSCKNTCESFNNPGVKCPCGPPGCFCREGLLKREDGKCVHPKQCLPNDPASRCPKNAIFIQCGSPCPPTCDFPQPELCEEKCITACYCKPGYLKRRDGVCVKPLDCHPRKKPEPKCPENSIFIECGSSCPPTCEDRFPVCEEKCTRACFCKPGFLLKTNEAKCVKPENCNASTTTPDAARCPINEVPSDCVIPCNDCKIQGTCKFFACNKGCDCKKGYFRNKDGKCILASECPEITDAARCPINEEHSDCVIPCNDCKIQGTCKFFACHKGCDCKKGYFRNMDGKCILASECPNIMEPQPICATDEQFYECTPSCKNTCENIHNPVAKCHCGPPGCFCKEGLFKRKDGKCVPLGKCEGLPLPECGEDQKFYNCTPSCKNTCAHFSNPVIRCGCGPPGCFCKEGLVKREDGKCIPPNQCHVCLVPGEEFKECGSTCPDTCENRGHPPPGSCSYRCNRGCFCRKGLYRTKRGECVPLKDCEREHHFVTTSKPTLKREKTDAVAATMPDDSHGCPEISKCEAYCKSMGDYIGLCTGPRHLHCRCAK